MNLDHLINQEASFKYTGWHVQTFEVPANNYSDYVVRFQDRYVAAKLFHPNLGVKHAINEFICTVRRSTPSMEDYKYLKSSHVLCVCWDKHNRRIGFALLDCRYDDWTQHGDEYA